MTRLLALVPYLTARPEGVRVAEAARDFGVTERQLRSDLELLWMCGLPGYGPGDLIDLSFEGDRVRVTFTAGMGRPLRLTTDEAVALVVALRTLLELPGLAEREAVSRALAKVSAAAGHAADRVTPVAVSVDAREEALAVVRDGLERKRALHLHYYVPTRDERTERTVDPMRLLLVDGKWYLEAWCRRAEGVRLFRLDRVDDVVVLDERAAPPPQAQERDVDNGVYQPDPGRRPCGCACPAAPAGSPTTTRSTPSPPLDDGGGWPSPCTPPTWPGRGGWWPPSAARRGSTSRPAWPPRSPPTPGRRCDRYGVEAEPAAARRLGSCRAAADRLDRRRGPRPRRPRGDRLRRARRGRPAAPELEAAERDLRPLLAEVQATRPLPSAAARSAPQPTERGDPRREPDPSTPGVASPVPAHLGGHVMAGLGAPESADHPRGPAALRRIQEAARRLPLARPLAAHLQGRDEGHEGRRRRARATPPPRPPGPRRDRRPRRPGPGDLTAQLEEEARIAEARAAELRARAEQARARPTAPADPPVPGSTTVTEAARPAASAAAPRRRGDDVA